MKNRKLLLIVSLVLALTMSLGGTLAYLTDTDADVNVMTVGRVSITQNEQERDAEGKLVAFTQNKPALPAVYAGSNIPWADASTWIVPNDQAWKTVENIPNVIDKFVTVTNTGNTDAYVRTIFAVEVGPDCVNAPYMHLVHNGTNITEGATWEWKWLTKDDGKDVVLTIDGNTYCFYEAVYTAKLAAKATTIPSLKQIYLDKIATNEIVANYGDKYEIIALSQAVQASGFEDKKDADGNVIMTAAEVALNEAFPYESADKDIKATLTEWFTKENLDIGTPGDKNHDNTPPVLPVVEVSDLAGLKDALDAVAESGEPVTIDGQDNNLGDMDEVTFPDGVVIKNATFTGDKNLGSYGNNANGTVTFVNCTFTSEYAYAAHFDGGNGELVFIDCVFKGWNSFGTTITGLTFKNCTFGHNGYFGLVRSYQNTTYTNCTFESNLEGVDVSEIAPQGTVIAFENCTGITVDKMYFNTDTDDNGNIIATAKGKSIFMLDGVDVSAQVEEW